MTLDVVLPAGGRISGEFAEEAGAEVKALMELGGQTVLGHTLAVLRDTGIVGRAVVIGPDEVREHPCVRAADAVLPEGGNSGPANILRGLEWLRENGSSADRVLIVTTDLPFFTTDAIVGFVDSCPPDADICAPLVRRESFESRFPGSAIQYVTRLADGKWTMGCGFLVNPEAIRGNQVRIEKAFAVRKSQLGMARMFGLRFMLRFLTGRLSTLDVEARCSEMLGCCVKAVRDSPPELAYDLDRIDEYRYAANYLSRGKELG